jgi:hypothetical protein
LFGFLEVYHRDTEVTEDTEAHPTTQKKIHHEGTKGTKHTKKTTRKSVVSFGVPRCLRVLCGLRASVVNL